MPTEKPYQVSVRLKVHAKPTQRVPPENTETATDSAIAILIDGDDRECDAIRVIEGFNHFSEEARYRRLLAAWIGLGDYLAKAVATSYTEEKNEANKSFILLAEVIDTMIGEVVRYIKDPEALIHNLLLAEMAGQLRDRFEQKLTELAAEPSKKFGTN